MIKTNANKNSLKLIREKEKAETEKLIKEKCEALAITRFGEDQVIKWSNANKGLWYLCILDETGENVEKFAIMKPIDRNILSYASQKISDAGLYGYLEACMNECWIEGDKELLEDDVYFIPAAQSFQDILEGKKAQMVKR